MSHTVLFFARKGVHLIKGLARNSAGGRKLRPVDSCGGCRVVLVFFPNKLVLLCYHALGLCSYADLEVTPISMWSGLSTFAEDQDRSS